MSKDESNETQADETPQEVVKWQEGDQTHGPKGFDVRGLPGCIRVKACRELGGIEVAIFETEIAFPHRAERDRDEKWTVKVIGMGDNGPMLGTSTRAKAMAAARHPSEWSKKCAKLVEKLAKEKAAAAEKKADDTEVPAE